MNVRASIVTGRLVHLGATLEQLQRLRDMDPAERSQEPLYLLAAQRALQVAAEAVFDIGHHVLAGRGHPVPRTYREILPALASLGILDAETVARLEGLAGFRNLLVHGYADVDPSILWSLVDERLEDLHCIQDAFAALPELA